MVSKGAVKSNHARIEQEEIRKACFAAHEGIARKIAFEGQRIARLFEHAITPKSRELERILLAAYDNEGHHFSVSQSDSDLPSYLKLSALQLIRETTPRGIDSIHIFQKIPLGNAVAKAVEDRIKRASALSRSA